MESAKDSSPRSDPPPGPPPPAPDRGPGTARPENLWLNLLCNLVLPILLLSKGSRWFGWSPAVSLVVALAFPLGYGIHDRLSRRKWNFLSILGLVSILAKGGIGLLGLDRGWVAVNEAALPLVFGAAVLATLRSRKPLVKVLLYSDQVFQVEKIEQALRARQSGPGFDRLLTQCTWLLASSFLLSAILNYGVAKIFVTADPATQLDLFTQQMARMQAWSYLIITVPSMALTLVALWHLVRGLHRLTGYGLEEIMIGGPSAPTPPTPDTP